MSSTLKDIDLKTAADKESAAPEETAVTDKSKAEDIKMRIINLNTKHEETKDVPVRFISEKEQAKRIKEITSYRFV